MNLKRFLAAGTMACMIAVTGCSSNIPENNQGNRNGMRLTASAADMRDGARTRSTWDFGQKRTRKNADSASSNANINRRARNSAENGYSANGTYNADRTYGGSGIYNDNRTYADRTYGNSGTYGRNGNYDSNGTYRGGADYRRSNVERSASAPIYRESRLSNAERLNRSTVGRQNVTPRTTAIPGASASPRVTVVPKVRITRGAAVMPKLNTTPGASAAPRVSLGNTKYGNVSGSTAGRTIDNRSFDITRGEERFSTDRTQTEKFNRRALGQEKVNEDTVMAMANTSSSINVKTSEIDSVIRTLTEIRNRNASTADTLTNRAAGQEQGNTVKRNNKNVQRIYFKTVKPNRASRTDANTGANAGTRSNSAKKTTVNRSLNKNYTSAPVITGSNRKTGGLNSVTGPSYKANYGRRKVEFNSVVNKVKRNSNVNRIVLSDALKVAK